MPDTDIGYRRLETKQQIFTLENGHVKILGTYVGLPLEEAKRVLSEQDFIEVSDDVAKGFIEGLGMCVLKFCGTDLIGSIIITTERKYGEDEMMTILGQVNKELRAEPHFDYNGYGVVRKPHEIDDYWDLDEGMVEIQWDGFNVHDFISRNNDGTDNIVFRLNGPIFKDEEYWRSEVD